MTTRFLSKLAMLGTTVLAVSVAVNVPQASAQSVPSTVDPSQLQKRLQPSLIQREERGVVIPDFAQEREAAVSDEKVFVLDNVTVSGGSVYTTMELERYYGDYIGQKVSFADLRAIAARMTTRYRNDGYILSRVIVPPQKVQDGTVTLQVVEGFISDVKFEGEIEGSRSLLEGYAKRITSERPITATKLERYMLLMDDLPGVTARSVVQPSTNVSKGATLIVSLEHDSMEAELGADNRGNRFLGPVQLRAVAAFNSALGMYDRNTFRIIATGEFDELFYGEFTHESQVGTDGTKAILRLAKTMTEPGSRLEPLNIEGDSHLAELYVSHPYLRSREENLEFFGGISLQNTESDILGAKFFEDRIRVGQIGIQYDNVDSWDGINLFEGSISQGLDFLGASDDGTGRSRVSGEHGFTRFNASLSRIQNFGANWSVFTALTGQYTEDSLLSAEQFALGGAGFGRAYDGAEITGDKGFATLIELRYAGFPSSGFIESYQPYAFYDVGSVWTNVPAVGEESRESLASTGVGVRFNLTGNYSGSAEVSLPLTRDVASEKDDDPRLFMSVSKRF